MRTVLGLKCFCLLSQEHPDTGRTSTRSFGGCSWWAGTADFTPTSSDKSLFCWALWLRSRSGCSFWSHWLQLSPFLKVCSDICFPSFQNWDPWCIWPYWNRISARRYSGWFGQLNRGLLPMIVQLSDWRSMRASIEQSARRSKKAQGWQGCASRSWECLGYRGSQWSGIGMKSQYLMVLRAVNSRRLSAASWARRHCQSVLLSPEDWQQ